MHSHLTGLKKTLQNKNNNNLTTQALVDLWENKTEVSFGILKMRLRFLPHYWTVRSFEKIEY